MIDNKSSEASHFACATLSAEAALGSVVVRRLPSAIRPSIAHRPHCPSEATAVPQLDTPLLADILLGLIVLLFVPFGIRRGVAKEAMVSAGLLFGVSLAAAWLPTVSDWLVRVWNLDPAIARFATTMVGPLGGMLILGYGGGAALGRTRPSVLARLSGGLLAACNGLILLVYLLAAIEQYLRPGAWIGDGIVSRTLIQDTDWVLLGVAGLLGLCVVLGVIVGSFRRGREPRFPTSVDDPAAGGFPVAPRHRPVRLSSSGVVDKYEPIPEPRSGRFAARLVPRASGEDAQTGHEHAPSSHAGSSWSAAPPSHANSPGNGFTPSPAHGATAPIGDDWLRRATGEPASSSASDRRCPRCGAPSRSTDIFCPECGQTL